MGRGITYERKERHPGSIELVVAKQVALQVKAPCGVALIVRAGKSLFHGLVPGETFLQGGQVFGPLPTCGLAAVYLLGFQEIRKRVAAVPGLQLRNPPPYLGGVKASGGRFREATSDQRVIDPGKLRIDCYGLVRQSGAFRGAGRMQSDEGQSAGVVMAFAF